MPRSVRTTSAANPVAADGNNIQFATTSRNAGSIGAPVAHDEATAIGEAPSVRRSERATRPSQKAKENNELQGAIQDIDADDTRPRAARKRKERDSNANDGPNPSSRRGKSASIAADIDHITLFRGRVGLLEDEEDAEDDSEEENEENEVKKPSKMRGNRPTGDIKERALVTDFNDPASIKENFPIWRSRGTRKYGTRNVPQALLQQYESEMGKARCVSAWRRMSPLQQKDVCDQIKAARDKKNAEEQERKEREKKEKQAAKLAEQQRKAAAKEAERLAKEEQRKAKKAEAERLRRAQAREHANANKIATRHLNPEDAVQASYSQQHIDKTSTKGKVRQGAPTMAKHLNDKVSRKAELKMLESFNNAQSVITPAQPQENWLPHNHLLCTSTGLPEAPRGNGGPASRNTIIDKNYDATKPLCMNVHCASDEIFGAFVDNLLNSDNPIVQAKLQERFERMQQPNADTGAGAGGADTRGVNLTIFTEMPSSSDRAIAETTQSVSALAADSTANIEREVVDANDTHSLFV